jgi:Flp pilus assembly protein TadD
MAPERDKNAIPAGPAAALKGETPDRAAPEGAATGEYLASDTPPHGAPTCEFSAAAPTASPPTCDFIPSAHFGTVEYQAPTEALDGSAPAARKTGEATCDFAADGAGQPQTASPAPANGTLPAPPDATATAAVPAAAGRYVFKKFHAKGGMGEVWLAEDSDIGRPVALKRIRKGRQNQSLQFVTEARVTGQLEHPGVIPVHELSLDDNGQPYYVMKFVHGQTLSAVIADYHKGKADPQAPREVQWLRLMNIFLDLCQTIAYAHSRGVIHRDIKPDNVMVGAYGETLVLDWGLAKIVGEPDSSDPHGAIQLSEADTMATLAGTVKGTPTFFAPEVATGKPEDVDQLSDVYLLGATLYTMITGKPPREGKNLPKLLELARTTPPVPPRQLDPAVPKPLDAICRKAIAHEKKDRYPSAAALAEDVQRYLAGETVAAYQENLLERAWRWVKRHRTALGRTAAALVILAVAGGAALWVRDAELRRIEDLRAADLRREEEVRAEETKRKIAQAEADQLQREELARQEIKNFRARADEAHFYAASANSVAEAIPGLDPAQAETKAAEALRIADNWGPEFDKMPLEAERPALKKDLYDLLVEIAQLKSRQDVKATQALLARAATVQTPTRSYYRLRSVCLLAQGDKAQADADEARANDPATPAAAMDYYLLGEQSRVASFFRAKDTVKEGKQAGIKGLLARGDALHEAIGFYRQALRDDPNHYWSHFQLGACYGGLGFHAQAAEALNACIALRPKAPWGYSSRGLALSKIKGREAEAEADLDLAPKLDPSFRPVRLHRAVFYATQKRYEEAEATFAEIVPPADMKPMPQAFFARGQMYMDRGMFEEAIADYEMVAAGEQPIRAVYLNLARCYLVEGKEQAALKSLASFVKADAQDTKPVELHERLGRELRLIAADFPTKAKNRREGVHLLALAELVKAVKLGGDSAALFDELGSTQENLGRLKEAVAAYSRALDAAPKDANVLIKRGWAYANLNENQKARADFARALATAPTNPEAHTGLGYTEALLKAPGPARIHANLALLHGGQDYLILHNTACIFGALSQTDAPRAKEYQDMALAQLQRAVDLWKQGGMRGPNEIQLIDVEPAFPPALRARPEFKKLLQKIP